MSKEGQMGVLGSFNIGVSGLRASGDSMNVIGDNIANAGTFGFKGSRAEFQDMLSRSFKGIDGGDQIGSGTKLAHVTPKFTQGTVSRTDNITDLALDGAGFFAVKSPWGEAYTRDGAFRFDKEGHLVTGDGYRVQGFSADANGKITSKKSDIKLATTTLPAKATEEVTVLMNLDSREIATQFNAENPLDSSNFNSSITVFDNTGTQRVVNLHFNKTADNAWEYRALVDGADAEGAEAGQLIEMASGKLQFNSKGQLQEVVENTNSFNFKGAEQGQKIKFNFGKTIADGGDGLDAITQYGSKSSLARHTQDGHSAGSLGSMSFNDDGILSASYDNGVTKELAQIAVARFDNNEGLFKMGRNLFKETLNSGQAALGKPGLDGRGNVLSKSIELSNVDIADEFINLMNAQRNFQANTKTISTTDQMLQEIIGIKR